MMPRQRHTDPRSIWDGRTEHRPDLGRREDPGKENHRRARVTLPKVDLGRDHMPVNIDGVQLHQKTVAREAHGGDI